MGNHMIEVRRATLTDKPAIFEFLSKAYAGRAQYKFPERWEWQFEKNPFRQGSELPIWIAVDEKRVVVGQVCAMFEPLKMGAEARYLAWPVDFVVLPEYRSQQIGTRLHKADFDDKDIFVALAMAGSSRRLVTKLGGVPIDSVTVFDRVVRFDAPSILAALRNRLTTNWPGKASLWLVHFLWLDRLMAILVNMYIGIRDLGLPRHGSADIDIQRVDEFDHTADQFWDSASPQFYAVVQRNSKYLNWKYVQQPHMDYQLFTASRRGKMCGYVILRRARVPESNSGIVADLLVPFEDRAAIHSLLTFAVRYFKHQKVNHIEAASSSDVYGSALRALGFRKKRDVQPLFHSSIGTPAVESARKPGSWFLGRSDHDWDQFPCA
jgi:GNAT superfamily N-acetyltransferase